MAERKIFFHAPCFDGIVSCAIAWQYLDAVGSPAPTTLQPVGYDLRGSWLERHLPAGSAVVDFLFHPDAAFWVDHHPTTFLSEQAQKVFAGAHRRDWLYDVTAPSCAGLLHRSLQEDRGHRNPAFDEVVRWADRIDSADYETVEDAVYPQRSAPAVALSLAVRPSSEYPVRLVHLLRDAKGDIDAVAKVDEVSAAIVDARRRVEIGIEGLRRGVMRGADDIVVFDVEEGQALVSRYAPYVIAPKARYSAGIVRRAGEAKITTMRNPWLDFRSANLGRLCARFGGGGHERVGSILLRGPDAARADEILRSVVSEIRSTMT